MEEEKTRTDNKNWFDTNIVPQIKEEDNDEIVGKPTHEGAAAKFAEINENLMTVSFEDKYIDHSLNIK